MGADMGAPQVSMNVRQAGGGVAVVDITGEVPDQATRDIVLRVARDEAARLRPDVQVEDHLTVGRAIAA